MQAFFRNLCDSQNLYLSPCFVAICEITFKKYDKKISVKHIKIHKKNDKFFFNPDDLIAKMSKKTFFWICDWENEK